MTTRIHTFVLLLHIQSECFEVSNGCLDLFDFMKWNHKHFRIQRIRNSISEKGCVCNGGCYGISDLEVCSESLYNNIVIQISRSISDVQYIVKRKYSPQYTGKESYCSWQELDCCSVVLVIFVSQFFSLMLRPLHCCVLK